MASCKQLFSLKFDYNNVFHPMYAHWKIYSLITYIYATKSYWKFLGAL